MEEIYLDFMRKQNLTPDASQLALVRSLENFENFFDTNSFILFSKLFKTLKAQNPLQHKGIYVWGEVGRGKSMIVDLFYNNLPTKKKLKRHFHEFMLEMHKTLDEYRSKPGQKDYINKLAANIANDFEVLYLDELQINNIADAMLVGRLFTEILKKGVLIFLTSNREPDELFKDGLQRERFIPFIELLKSELQVFHLNNNIDYRLEKLKTIKQTYLYPLNEQNQKTLDLLVQEITGGKKLEEKFIRVDENREVRALNTYGQIAIFTFNELCALPLGAQDYLALCKQFSTFIITNIPKLEDFENNEALRFITLVDCMYNSRTKLICTADSAPEKLYTKGKHRFEFQRTISRLVEMQSTEYFNSGFEA